MNRNKIILVGLLATAVVAIGCGGGEAERAGTVDAPPGTAATGEQAGGEQPAALPMDNKTAQRYADGFAVRVGPAKKFRPSSSSAGHTPGNTAFRFDVTFINGSKEIVDVALTTIEATLGAEGVSAEQVFDQGLDDLTSGKLAPGRRKTITVGFSAPTKDLSVVDVTVKPGFLDYEDALFTGKVRP